MIDETVHENTMMVIDAINKIEGNNVGSIAVAQREKSEIESALIIAKKFPRDEVRAEVKLIEACQNAEFADDSLYQFSRAGQSVIGPSVHMAREAARLWGNITSGLRVLSSDDDNVHIMGFAYDLESNTRIQAEDSFRKLVQRKNYETKKTEWRKPDERDLRELINRRGALLVRNCILQLIPSHVVNSAVKRSLQTQSKAATNSLEKSRPETIRTLAGAFNGLGISTEMLAGFLGHGLELINESELVELRRIYGSIKDGNSTREEHFELRKDPESGASEETQKLTEKLKNKKAE